MLGSNPSASGRGGLTGSAADRTRSTRLAGPLAKTLSQDPSSGRGLAEEDSRLLGLLVEGRTNRDIADEIGANEQEVAARLAELFVRIGASSRVDATVAALVGGLI